MAQRNKGKGKTKGTGRMLAVLHPEAAGIDVGAEDLFVAVSPDRAAESVRSFETFTRDLHELGDWLQSCGVWTVAMESTGVYWIPVFQILETRGFEVFLVNAQHVRNVPGRKSDVSDCQWIQYLHSVGLLKASFRPPDQICVLRSLWRHRESLVQMAAEHTMHMQKALSQMNLQLHHVERHHRPERNEDTRCYSGRRTRSGKTRSSLPWHGPKSTPKGRQIPRRGLPGRTPVRSQAVTCCISVLSEAYPRSRRGTSSRHPSDPTRRRRTGPDATPYKEVLLPESRQRAGFRPES